METAQRISRQISRGLVVAFGFLVCLIFGIALGAQIAGLAGLYRLLPVLVLTLLLTAAACLVYFRWDPLGWLPAMTQKGGLSPRMSWLDLAGYAAGLAAFFLIILLPLIRWPFSPVSDVLHWDAGAYHFPKAIEMFKTGSIWDLSIPYGEYPGGFESLLAFSLLLTGSEALFGSAHALIALFAFLSIWILAWRYTRLPGGLLALLITALFASGEMVVANNPWWIMSNQVFMIGKNDLLVSAGVLAVIAHAPIASRGEKAFWHLPGLALASAIVLAVKPVGVYAAVPFWLPLLFDWGRRLFQPGQAGRPWREILFSAAVTVPAATWIGRNLLVIGMVFPPGSWEMNEWSIANNLTNPYFYNYLPRLFLFVLGAIGLVLVLTAWRRSPSVGQAVALAVLVIGFIITPQTAFFGGTQHPTHIGWRFGMSLLCYLFVLFLVIAEPLILRIFAWLEGRRVGVFAAALALVLIGVGLVWDNRGLLRILPGNDIVLRDQFRDPVGVDGYFSAYEYVRENIHNSVVQIDNGLMYYVYGEGFSNLPTKQHYPIGLAGAVPQREPQYYVTFCTNFWAYLAEECPEYLSSPAFTGRWQLIYLDDYGRVYRRLPGK